MGLDSDIPILESLTLILVVSLKSKGQWFLRGSLVQPVSRLLFKLETRKFGYGLI